MSEIYLTRDEAIDQACAIIALAYHTIGNYSAPSDGFCERCCAIVKDDNCRNSGDVLDYVRKAVIEKLKKDGYSINPGFDPETGRERK